MINVKMLKMVTGHAKSTASLSRKSRPEQMQQATCQSTNSLSLSLSLLVSHRLSHPLHYY